MKNILVTGASGQLGYEIQQIHTELANSNFIFTDIQDLDITNLEDISCFFERTKIDFIINCAAYTAVDKAEKEIQESRLVNVVAVSYLAEISQKYDIPIIHISTDYVFDGLGNQPINEFASENPASVYGKSKFDGEEILVASYYKHFIIRTSWLYSSHGNNFVKTMLNISKTKKDIKVVYDQIGTPTYAADLASVIITICRNYLEDGIANYGIYHYSNEGVASWYDFAHEIFRIKNIECDLSPILSSEYQTLAKRPLYSVLDKTKIKQTFNLKIPHWKDSLRVCLAHKQFEN